VHNRQMLRAIKCCALRLCAAQECVAPGKAQHSELVSRGGRAASAMGPEGALDHVSRAFHAFDTMRPVSHSKMTRAMVPSAPRFCIGVRR
jgi:hypothetical protein